jgi:nucleoside-diphosphate-sugar epimerase
MNILITGSEGNIGRRLSSYLEKNHNVFCIDIKQNFKPSYKTVDINSSIDLLDVFETFRPDVVFHLAAMVSRVTCEISPATTILTNVNGTNNIIQLCKKYKSKLINFSTSEVYGNQEGILSESSPLFPNNLYGTSKMLAEQLVNYERSNGLIAINVRPFMFYDEEESTGSNRSAMIRWGESLLNRKKIDVHTGSERSWLHINDGVKILERLIYVEEPVINVGSPFIYKMRDVAEIMCRYLSIDQNLYISEIALPEKMTLIKHPDLSIQRRIAPIIFEYDIERGISLVIDNLRKRQSLR